jgi:hypothetical protein
MQMTRGDATDREAFVMRNFKCPEPYAGRYGTTGGRRKEMWRYAVGELVVVGKLS